MEKFSESLQKFIDFALEVSTYGPGGTIAKGGSPLHACIFSYNKIFQDTKESNKHYAKVLEIYQQCKPVIKQADGLADIMDWLKDSSLTIQPKEGAKSRLPVSLIYRKCCDIVKSRETLEDVSNLDYYREHFCFFLLKVFVTMETEDDMLVILNHYISQIDEQLKLDGDDPDPKDPFSAMIKTTMNAAKKAGLSMPTGNLDMNQLAKMGNELLQGPVMEDTLVGLFKEIKASDAKGPEEMIGSLISTMMNKLGTGDFPEPLQKAIDAKANQ